MIPPNHAGWRGGCRVTETWYRRTRMFEEKPRWWWCMHAWMCTVCGKHIRDAIDAECPDRPNDVPVMEKKT